LVNDDAWRRKGGKSRSKKKSSGTREAAAMTRKDVSELLHEDDCIPSILEPPFPSFNDFNSIYSSLRMSSPTKSSPASPPLNPGANVASQPIPPPATSPEKETEGRTGTEANAKGPESTPSGESKEVATPKRQKKARTPAKEGCSQSTPAKKQKTKESGSALKKARPVDTPAELTTKDAPRDVQETLQILCAQNLDLRKKTIKVLKEAREERQAAKAARKEMKRDLATLKTALGLLMSVVEQLPSAKAIEAGLNEIVETVLEQGPGQTADVAVVSAPKGKGKAKATGKGATSGPGPRSDRAEGTTAVTEAELLGEALSDRRLEKFYRSNSQLAPVKVTCVWEEGRVTKLFPSGSIKPSFDKENFVHEEFILPPKAVKAELKSWGAVRWGMAFGWEGQVVAKAESGAIAMYQAGATVAASIPGPSPEVTADRRVCAP
jgi:hypothetical protein